MRDVPGEPTPAEVELGLADSAILAGWARGRFDEPGAALAALLDRAHRDLTTLEIELEDWERPTATMNLVVPADEGIHDTTAPVMHWVGAGPFPRPRHRVRRISYRAPDHLRVEVSGGGVRRRILVRRGSEWWRWDARDGTSTGRLGGTDDSERFPPLLEPPVLEPIRILAALRLDVTGTAVRAGRDVIVARATPRQQWPRDPSVRVLEFDMQHGTLLRSAAYLGGTLARVTKVVRVVYDAPLEDRVFVPEFHPSLGGPRAGTPHRSELAGGSEPIPGPDFGPTRTGMKGIVFWLTGLPSAGKSSIARAMTSELASIGLRGFVLDGDEVRGGLSSDLSLSRADRAEQGRRVAHVAAILARTGVIPIVALVSPYVEDRARARRIITDAQFRFCEVWVDTPVDVCASRDPKRLYQRAASGDLCGLTGVDAPYEVPDIAEARVHGFGISAATAARSVLENIGLRGGTSDALRSARNG